MDLQISVTKNISSEILEICRSLGANPKEIVESDGFDGVSVVEVILRYGPDSLALLTAVLAFWNEAEKLKNERSKRRLEITLESKADE